MPKNGLNALAEEIAEVVAERLRERHVEQRVLTTAEAAKYLGVSDEKMRQLANNRVIRAVRIDSSYRFDLRDLDLLIETHKR